MNGQELIDLSGRLQQDLRDAQAKLVLLRAGLAALNLPDVEAQPPCPLCGLGLPKRFPLAEHLANVHGDEKRAEELRGAA